MASIDELIGAAPDLGVHPQSLTSLMTVIDDPTVSAQEILPVVETDPGLTAGLLKLCNSPLYGLRRRVATPKEALVMLGNLTFARLCFALTLKPALSYQLDGYGYDLDELWAHSLRVAYCAGTLASSVGDDPQRDRAFVAGLLHDIGKIVLNPLLAQQDRPVASDPIHADVALSEELRAVGHTHAAIGAELLSSWGVPEQICRAVRDHHDPEPIKTEPISLAAKTANTVDRFASVRVDPSVEVPQPVYEVVSRAGYSEATASRVWEALAKNRENQFRLACG